MKISHMRVLRFPILWVLERFGNTEITIRHHYTRTPLTINAYQHKGYWYYGKRREQRTMSIFERVIAPGETVYEVGGHIGYITQFFAELVGPSGSVLVFEPAPDNLRYIERNIKDLPQVSLFRSAVSNRNGVADLQTESLTGQNNTLEDHYDRFDSVRAFSGRQNVEYTKIEVNCTTLDSVYGSTNKIPDLIKIDVEGHEHQVLQGMTQLLSECDPVIMVEVTKYHSSVFEQLRTAGFYAYTDSYSAVNEPEIAQGNTFFVRPSNKHYDLFQQMDS